MKNLVATVILCMTSACSANAATCDQPGFAAAAVPELARLINEFREKNGARALSLAPQLADAAQEQACALAAKDRFTHDGSGGPKSRMKRAGCRTRYTAENIAMGFSSANETMRLWLDSIPHRKILLMRRMTVMGIGVAGPRPSQGGGPRWVLDLSAGC